MHSIVIAQDITVACSKAHHKRTEYSAFYVKVCSEYYCTVFCYPIMPFARQYSTIQYSTVQYSTVQYSTVQYSTVQYSTVQYSTVQYSTVHHSTVQYSTLGSIVAQCSKA